MNNFEEDLKDAIACNDIDFLKKNRDQYDINHRFADEDNDSLLLYAISDKGSEAYKFFLDNGADTTLVNNEGEGILHAIVYSGIPERLLEFIKTHTFDINARTNDGATPLLLAISLERLEMAKLLIENRADVNIGDENDITPLHLAVQTGDFNLVVSLVEKGANLHIKTQKGNYPLALAINGDHDKIVRYLFEKIYLGCK
ncbi:MAG: ankyrin repeat domain-containing protein [Candidatus Azobacteroides sp.]|nr:ankyrin repeat domain-containing protein [Candidatus Azobacteroides sp.]